jgi:aminoglycoside phosphotransferase (APT) family kinase protein
VLGQAEIAPYLMRRGLLAAGTVVDGAVVVREVSSRNSNFAVAVDGGPSYLLKQGRSAAGAATIAREAAVFEELLERGEELRRFLPGVVGYDREAGVLALELLPGAEDLRSRQTRTEEFPAALAGQLGTALGTLHREMRGTYPPPTPTPGILSIHRPDTGVFRDSAAASLELIRIVQEDEGLGERLDELRDGWRVETLIHQDAKWENCLVAADGRLYLVDWEVAVGGDPHWDLGTALGQYLGAWLFSIPVTGEEPAERFPALARFPLERMKGALGELCDAYALAADERPSLAEEDLHRTVAYAGAHLLLAAYESSQFAPRLDGTAILHLQLGSNLTRRPADAAERLLGLAAAPA